MFMNKLNLINPKGGGGLKVPAGQEIACHFSQDHPKTPKPLEAELISFDLIY